MIMDHKSEVLQIELATITAVLLKIPLRGCSNAIYLFPHGYNEFHSGGDFTQSRTLILYKVMNTKACAMSHRAISGLYDIALKEKPMVIMDILC